MSSKEMLFGKTNYMLMAAGAVLVLIGFMLMAGGGNQLGTDGYAHEFDASIYSFRRITLSVIVILIGFGVEAFAIVKAFKK